MQIQVFSGGPFFVNSYVLYNERGGEGVVVDPGLETTKIKSFIGGRKIRIHSILLTHGHVDHLLYLNDAHEATNARICLHEADQALYDNAVEMARYFGILTMESPHAVDWYLREGEEIVIGEEKLQVIFTPGHSPGSVCFRFEDEFVLTGDTLFNDGIGRTDLPGGSYEQIQASIRSRLLTLPPSMIIYPGHGPSSTVGFESANNPFVGA
jgi:glyoxylase-like metal-dependent hydrolase (beta-lactamase superfamily II)